MDKIKYEHEGAVDIFLDQCRISSLQAYELYKQLLDDLENPSFQKSAFLFIRKVHHHVEILGMKEDKSEPLNFSFSSYSVHCV